MRALRIVPLLILLLLPAVAWGAISANVGDQIELKATHHSGVPLHDEPRGTDDFQRVSDGARATVLAIQPGNGWLQIRLADGREGWIAPKYVARIVTGGGQGPGGPGPGGGTGLSPAEEEGKVWGSRAGCEEVVQAGGRLAREIPGTLRAGAWNVRWFPRGCSSGESCPENATDLDWLACTVAWMDVDLLAVEEILETPAAVQAMTQVRGRLDALTGGSWQTDLSDCGPPGAQHLGFLWNSRRVTLGDQADSCELNGAATPGPSCDACAGNLRPGRYARVRSARNGGADFHVAAVHFDSGKNDGDYDHRRIATEQISLVSSGGTPVLESDGDLVILGDINTMGRDEPPPISAAQEISLFDNELAPAFEAHSAIRVQRVLPGRGRPPRPHHRVDRDAGRWPGSAPHRLLRRGPLRAHRGLHAGRLRAAVRSLSDSLRGDRSGSGRLRSNVTRRRSPACRSSGRLPPTGGLAGGSRP
jgi:hypothetical protein